MERYDTDLIETRKSIAKKSKEIRQLEDYKRELWNKLIKEFNSNLAKYHKMEGLSGIIKSYSARDTVDIMAIEFDLNSKPTARALTQIEDTTGLCFLYTDEHIYYFGLP